MIQSEEGDEVLISAIELTFNLRGWCGEDVTKIWIKRNFSLHKRLCKFIDPIKFNDSYKATELRIGKSGRRKVCKIGQIFRWPVWINLNYFPCDFVTKISFKFRWKSPETLFDSSILKTYSKFTHLFILMQLQVDFKNLYQQLDLISVQTLLHINFTIPFHN